MGDHYSIARLPSIIAERKKEVRDEARRKRAVDLEITPNLSISDDSRMNPVEYLPTEMWEKILEYLTDPSDMDRARTTCTLFNDLLKRKYFSQVIFPKVFSLDSFRKVFDLERLEGPSAEIMKLRLVSKDWKDGVDTYFEEDIKKCWDPSVSFRREKHTTINLLRCYGGQEERIVDRILANLNATGGRKMLTPKLFSRSVSVDIWDVQRLPGETGMNIQEVAWSQFTKVTKLLKLVGDQIWYFSVNLTRSCMRESLSQAYRLICDWMKYTPQLRVLKVDFNLRNIRDASIINGVRNAIRECPFPTLPKLEYFGKVCIIFEDGDGLLQLAILESNPHVKYLDAYVEFRTPATETRTDTLLQMKQGITQASRIDLMVNYTITGETPVEDALPMIISDRWPLKRFHLGDPSMKTNIPGLFQFLENFPTLEVLQFQLPFDREDLSDFLNLPNVTHLCIVADFLENIEYEDCNWIYEPDVDSEPDEGDDDGSVERHLMEREIIRKYSIDFMLPMKKLECLIWRSKDPLLRHEIVENDDKWEHEIIQFRAGQVDILDSNIWDVFPKLNSILFQQDDLDDPLDPVADFHMDTSYYGGTLFRRSDLEGDMPVPA